MPTNITPKIIVHGGAGGWKNRDPDQAVQGVREAAAAGWAVLREGGSALDAVEVATVVLEDDPLYDAGVGSFLNDQGEIEMDALIADGRTVNFGAVGAVRHVRNPIKLARLVLTDTDNCFFVADGADQLAAHFGLETVPNITFVTDHALKQFQERRGTQVTTGTVGAVAIDSEGHIASATSTGGIPDKKKGRVGDSPIFGAGGYADDRSGGVSATGVGENIMRYFLSKHAADLIASGQSPQEAAANAIEFLASRIPEPEVGLIVIGADARIGAAHSTAAMPIAWIDDNGQIQAAMRGPHPFR